MMHHKDYKNETKDHKERQLTNHKGNKRRNERRKHNKPK